MTVLELPFKPGDKLKFRTSGWEYPYLDVVILGVDGERVSLKYFNPRTSRNGQKGWTNYTITSEFDRLTPTDESRDEIWVWFTANELLK